MYKYSGYRLDVQWCDNNIIKKITKPTYMQMSLVFWLTDQQTKIFKYYGHKDTRNLHTQR